jgi:hypothetical protein
MRVLFIPILRFIEVLIRCSFIALIYIILLILALFYYIWYLHIRKSAEWFEEMVNETFTFDRFEKNNAWHGKKYAWSNPIQYIFDINNKKRVDLGNYDRG